MDIESKVYPLSMLGRKKRGSRLRLCFWVVEEVPERNDWICESRYMSSSKCLFTYIFAGFYLPINPSATTVYARSAFYPSLHFTLSLQSAFYTQSAFYPWSAVCSLQSGVCVLLSVCSLHFTLSLHFTPGPQSVIHSLRFTLSLQSAFYTQSAFYPWSAVCSPQSAVCVLH